MPSTLNESDLLDEISRQWDLAFIRWRVDLPLAGSPERTIWRRVVEATDNRLFVLEKIPSTLYARKRQIISTLNELHRRGLSQIIPYQPDTAGDPLPFIQHGLWQLSPFVDGIDLDRPVYTMDSWRGDVTADFLIQLNTICSQAPSAFDTPTFSIADYVEGLFTTLTQQNPTIADRYRSFIEHLEGHFNVVHDDLPTAFCHGDYHPVNMIWGEKPIRAVIDWEFCGIKPEAYDLANLLGCLGMEDPQSLAGPWVQRLVKRLRRSRIYSDESWEALPDLMLAIRFAWLSEWMRKEDWPMIRLEADFMSLLLGQRQDLKSIGLGA